MGGLREQNLANLQTSHEHIAQCADMIEAHEMRVGGRYLAAVRVRDNTLVVRPFVLPTLGTSFHSPAVYVKGCNGWQGLNDKVAVAPGKLLRSFSSVALAMRRQNE